MTAFVQLVELKSSRYDEIQRVNDEWRERNPDRGYNWLLLGADRDRPNIYVAIVHFDSYEAAMKNSEDPRTTEYAEKMASLCDEPPTFRNLDIKRVEGFDR